MELPKRKYIRLKNYDYSQNGYYFVTICTENNLPILSKVTDLNVGWGLAPTEDIIKLSEIGKICEMQLFELGKRYPNVRIDKYVIMPTHIHLIVVFSDLTQTVGASPHPTLMDVVSAFKSLSTRLANINDNVQGRKIFQISFFEKIIRNEEGYLKAWRYIDENPLKWKLDKYYAE